MHLFLVGARFHKLTSADDFSSLLAFEAIDRRYEAKNPNKPSSHEPPVVK